jgi:hypothetical protein
MSYPLKKDKDSGWNSNRCKNSINKANMSILLEKGASILLSTTSRATENLLQNTSKPSKEKPLSGKKGSFTSMRSSRPFVKNMKASTKKEPSLENSSWQSTVKKNG